MTTEATTNMGRAQSRLDRARRDFKAKDRALKRATEARDTAKRELDDAAEAFTSGARTVIGG